VYDGRISVEGLPDLIANLRLDMANALRAAAAGHSPEVQRFANEVAAIFETGVRP
jgi:hypothetical protein